MARFGLVTVLAIAGVVAIAVAWERQRETRIAENEAKAVEALHAFAAAEVDFQKRDGKFWTRDVAGLPLIPRGLAEADPSRPGARPWNGFWFVAMDHYDGNQDYRQGPGKDRHNFRFAFCAYPARYGRTGRSTFSLNEAGMVSKESLQGKPRLAWEDAWPTDAEFKLFYTKIE
jgi:hypothetical protein